MVSLLIAIHCRDPPVYNGFILIRITRIRIDMDQDEATLHLLNRGAASQLRE
jgi:hypothetical protein